MPLDLVQDLVLHLEARYPLIFLLSQEEERALAAVREAAERTGRTVVTPRGEGKDTPLSDLFRLAAEEGTVLVLDDVHRRLEDPSMVRVLGDLALAADRKGRTTVVLAPWVDLPPELEREAAVLELPLPGPAELRDVLGRVSAEVGVLQTDDDAAALVRVAQGLTLDEAARAFRKAMIGWPEDAQGAGASVMADKRRALRRSRVLEHVAVPGSLDEVGGLDQLKGWLVSRADAFSDRARAYGLPAPRGLLLMGVQGCGKSLTAKAVAGHWRLPLVRLDVSAVFGAPRPEEALRVSLRLAEAMAPVVLWIDEIEKGFEKSGEGAAARVLGGMVTWLQEKRAEVFVVATANRVASLPPELPRKGRFDEIFFVDLPNVHERREIFRLHVAKRGRKPEAFDLNALAVKSERLTGSEIEQAVIAALYTSFGRGGEPTNEDLTYAVSETVPLYEMFEDEIKALREWARKRARPASTDRRKIDFFAEEG
ncbi:MAG: AAA family ATPase [Deltaproteobacteria bacterium]|nr:AAA family ATPase [Deltaproteobacteria bacterium]